MYIKSPSEAVQLEAIRLGYDSTILFINNPTEAAQIASVIKSPKAIQYIKNPCQAVIDLVKVMDVLS